jgi:hypothetical protein
MLGKFSMEKMFSVNQPWDPLKVCVVGRAYSPEFYSWIKNPQSRNIFEKLAIETEEDFQAIIKKLESFGVKILRPELPATIPQHDQCPKPPITPRDHMVMIGNRFYSNIPSYNFGHFYYNLRKQEWPDCSSIDAVDNLPNNIKQQVIQAHEKYVESINNTGYSKIFEHIKNQKNIINDFVYPSLVGSMVSRIGKDLYFGTFDYKQDCTELKNIVSQEFSDYRNHIINTGGHGDGTYTPVCPGLIISLYDVPTYAETFPGWEVVYLPPSKLNKRKEFQLAKALSHGNWWLQGHETNKDVAHIVNMYMNTWTGYAEETVFDVNMLIIDPKNVLVFNYNKRVFDALDRYGITPHIVPFRHRYFWDGGVHCITTDLHREGTMQDYFPDWSFK